MSSIPRNLPRFLPTLTEVVPPSAVPTASLPATPAIDEIVQSVLQRVAGASERRLREETEAMLRTLVAQQLPVLQARLRLELEAVVRQAVLEAMAPPADLHKTK